MSRMTMLAAIADQDQVSELYQTNLPLPNIYFTSVVPFNGATRHLYVAADFTGAALAKVHVHCIDNFGFRPTRSSSDVKFRRMRLGDVMENPAGYESALNLAKQMGESDLVRKLEALPQWIADKLGVPLPGSLSDRQGSNLLAELSRQLIAADERAKDARRA